MPRCRATLHVHHRRTRLHRRPATDRSIVVERFRDEIGDWRIVVLSPFGGRVHAPWALAIRNRYRNETGGTVDVIWSDDGIILRFPDVDTPPDTAIVAVDAATVEDIVIDEVADSALFTSKFREAAAGHCSFPVADQAHGLPCGSNVARPPTSSR